MRILIAASEAAPLAKVGGLGDVIGSLSNALNRLGHDVRLIIPQYGCINISQYQLAVVKDKFETSVSSKADSSSLAVTILKDTIPVYLVENSQYFGDKEVYGRNDLKRFLFFSKAVAEILPQLDWQPEIVHCHDWHTALLVMWLNKMRYPAASVFTIHNLAYQGFFDETFLFESGLEKDWNDYSHDVPKSPFNFMSQGILWAGVVTTVSETYAQEILTPERGEGLDGLLRTRRAELRGILNGIDYQEYDPGTDPHIPAGYDSSTLEKRAINKLALQQRSNLSQDAGVPLIGMVQRLDEQKGFDILEKALVPILETGVQMVVLGRGRDRYENMLHDMAARYPRQMAVFLVFDNPLAHLIYAGCDMFLMPSRFEPCGLGQMIAMRYGALPVVRHTGGLIETVSELTPDLTAGSGFVFKEYTSEALLNAVRRAVEAFKNKRAWQSAMRRVMKLDFSWQASAAKYEAAYRRAIERKSMFLKTSPGGETRLSA